MRSTPEMISELEQEKDHVADLVGFKVERSSILRFVAPIGVAGDVIADLRANVEPSEAETGTQGEAKAENGVREFRTLFKPLQSTEAREGRAFFVHEEVPAQADFQADHKPNRPGGFLPGNCGEGGPVSALNNGVNPFMTPSPDPIHYEWPALRLIGGRDHATVELKGHVKAAGKRSACVRKLHAAEVARHSNTFLVRFDHHGS